MKDKPNRRGPCRILAGLAVAAVLAMPMAPAQALDRPVVGNHYFEGTWTPTTSTVSGNVLENDTWDADHDIEVIAVESVDSSPVEPRPTP